MPSYFPITATWLNAISSVLDMRMVEQPLHPHTRMPASFLMTATRR